MRPTGVQSSSPRPRKRPHARAVASIGAKGLGHALAYRRSMSKGPELIITEKDNAARRIADILSGASANRRNGVNVYGGETPRRWSVGHVVGVDSPRSTTTGAT